MKLQHCRGSIVGVARVAKEIAERRAAELDKIASDLEAGDDQQALAGMREYFHQRKPIDREKVYDREHEESARA